jgi:hypothetical protein
MLNTSTDGDVVFRIHPVVCPRTPERPFIEIAYCVTIVSCGLNPQTDNPSETANRGSFRHHPRTLEAWWSATFLSSEPAASAVDSTTHKRTLDHAPFLSP